MNLQDGSTELLAFGYCSTPCCCKRSVVPHRAIDRLYKRSKQHNMASPTLAGCLRSSLVLRADDIACIVTDVQIVFGTIKHVPDEKRKDGRRSIEELPA